MSEIDTVLHTIIYLAGPIFALFVFLKLAPQAYLAARRGGEDQEQVYAVYGMTLSGITLIAASVLAVAMRGMVAPPVGEVFFSPPFLTVVRWIAAAAVIGSLPYWLVRTFHPTSPFFDRLDRELAPSYGPDRDYYPTTRKDDE